MGEGAAAIHDLPDPVLSRVLAVAGKQQGPAVTLVCKRFHALFFAEPSLWHSLRLDCKPPGLAGKRRHLQRVGSLVAELSVARADLLPAMSIVGGGGDRWTLGDVLGAVQPSKLWLEGQQPWHLEPGDASAIQGLTQLRQLGCYGPEPPWALLDSLEPLRQLTALSIACTVLDIGRLSRLTQLRSLILYSERCAPAAPGALAAGLAALTSLSRLDLRSCRGLPPLQPLTALRQLRRMAAQPVVSLPAPTDMAGSLAFFEFEGNQGGRNGFEVGRAQLTRCRLTSWSGGKERGAGAGATAAPAASPIACTLCVTVACVHSWASLLAALLPPGLVLRSLRVQDSDLAQGWHRHCCALDGLEGLELLRCRNLEVALEALPALAPALTRLHLEACDVAGQLPPGLPTIASLRSLTLREQHLSALPAGAYLRGLTALDLSNNCFPEVPPALAAATALRQLSLRANQPPLERGEVLQALPGLALEQLEAGKR